jgi:hypothetical protein
MLGKRKLSTLPNSARSLVAGCLVCGTLVSAWAAEFSGQPEAPALDQEASTLVTDLISQQPAKPLELSAVFKVRHSNNRRSEIPVKYSVRLAIDHWESIYATEATSFQGAERLVVVHRGTEPNRYDFQQISLDGTRTNSIHLNGAEAALPFADTDFWLTDLGLEFLHWPLQRLVRDAKITMRLGRPCKVLESTNPKPAEGSYGRVISWIDSELGNLIYAEAYDAHNRRYKVFSLGKFKKVNGRWQVTEMVLRDDKADSRTQLDFIFQPDP